MIYGYARVSTKGQARDGNSLEEQVCKLKEAGATKIFSESFTGTKKDRPELGKLLDLLQPGDTVIVTKLDRLARSIKFGSDIIEELANKGVSVNILNLGLMNDTPNGKLIRNIFLAFAEFERDMIVERTQEGKETARCKEGFKDGRPKKEIPNLEQYIKLYYAGMVNKAQASTLLGISKDTFARRLKDYESKQNKIGKVTKNLDKRT